MVSKKTKFFGLIHIYLVIAKILVVSVFLALLLISKKGLDQDMEKLGDSMGYFGLFIYLLVVVGVIVLIALLVILSLYLVFHVLNYRKLQKDRISNIFFIINLIIVFLLIFKNGGLIFFSFFFKDNLNNYNIIVFLLNLLSLSILVTGAIYSVFGLVDYSQDRKNKLLLIE